MADNLGSIGSAGSSSADILAALEHEYDIPAARIHVSGDAQAHLGGGEDDWAEEILTCRTCGADHLVVASVDEWVAHYFGRPAQDAFASLEGPHRELFISGTCADCWTAMVGPGPAAPP